MAYLKEMQQPRCSACRKRATHILFNRLNSPVGYYCGPCGRKEQRRLEVHERTEETRASRR